MKILSVLLIFFLLEGSALKAFSIKDYQDNYFQSASLQKSDDAHVFLQTYNNEINKPVNTNYFRPKAITKKCYDPYYQNSNPYYHH